MTFTRLGRPSLLTLILTGAAFAQTSAPATAPTTTQADGPKQAMVAFVTAMLDGDQKAVFDRLVITDPANKPIAEAIFAPELARRRLFKAVVAAFPDDPTAKNMLPDPNDLKTAEKDIMDSALTVTGNDAVLTSREGEKMTLVNRDGKWRIDFDKTQKQMGPPPGPDDMKTLAAQAKAFDTLAADVAAKKYKTAADVETAMMKAMSGGPPDSAPAPAPAPATRP